MNVEDAAIIGFRISGLAFAAAIGVRFMLPAESTYEFAAEVACALLGFMFVAFKLAARRVGGEGGMQDERHHLLGEPPVDGDRDFEHHD